MALIQADFFSKSLMRTVTVNVIIPTDKAVFPAPIKKEMRQRAEHQHKADAEIGLKV